MTTKTITAYPDYEVSDSGLVYSTRRGRRKPLSPGHASGGYLQVCLYGKGGKKLCLVHRLVAIAFLGEPGDENNQINHRNGDKTDNRAENLEWTTPTRNRKHAYEIGLQSMAGENHTQHKLTEADVMEIVALLDSGFTQAEIAGQFNVARETISAIKTGRAWSYLTGITRT